MSGSASMFEAWMALDASYAATIKVSLVKLHIQAQFLGWPGFGGDGAKSMLQ